MSGDDGFAPYRLKSSSLDYRRIKWEGNVLYMIVEDFRGDPAPVYLRFRERGRLAPEGLRYIGSWVTQDLGHCYQVMECDDPALLQEWMENWKDLVDFQVAPVMTSAEAARASTAGSGTTES